MPVVRVLLQLAVASVLSAVGSGETYAYGPTGHGIVGVIAESLRVQRSKAEDRCIARRAVARQRRSVGPTGSAAIRSGRRRRPGITSTFRTTRRSRPRVAATAATSCRPSRAFAQRAADESLSEERRTEALRFVVHFVADLHQPLHVGREEDRGGNRIDVVVDWQTNESARPVGCPGTAAARPARQRLPGCGSGSRNPRADRDRSRVPAAHGRSGLGGRIAGPPALCLPFRHASAEWPGRAGRGLPRGGHRTDDAAPERGGCAARGPAERAILPAGPGAPRGSISH